MPFPVTLQVLEKGQERYNIYWHAVPLAGGQRRGHDRRARLPSGGELPYCASASRLRLGHFFNVISNGYGAMPDYASQITVEDRWAITAYVRALQLSQNAKCRRMSASGGHVEPLTDIEEREGFAPSVCHRVGPAADCCLWNTEQRGLCACLEMDLQPNSAAPPSTRELQRTIRPHRCQNPASPKQP